MRQGKRESKYKVCCKAGCKKTHPGALSCGSFLDRLPGNSVPWNSPSSTPYKCICWFLPVFCLSLAKVCPLGHQLPHPLGCVNCPFGHLLESQTQWQTLPQSTGLNLGPGVVGGSRTSRHLVGLGLRLHQPTEVQWKPCPTESSS